MLSKEVALIKGAALRERVIEWLAKAPKKFWGIPASSSGKYHSADECVPGGCVLHTRRVVAMVLVLAPAYSLSPEGTDLCIAAALLHDVMKQGDGDDPLVRCSREEYDRHGPNIQGWFISRFGTEVLNDAYASEVIKLVTSHMGPWSPDGIRPYSPTAWCLFMADYMASRKWVAPVVPLA